MEERCNYFASNGVNDPIWAFNTIVRFLQFQKERVEKEITGATLRNFIINFFYYIESHSSCNLGITTI